MGMVSREATRVYSETCSVPKLWCCHETLNSSANPYPAR